MRNVADNTDDWRDFALWVRQKWGLESVEDWLLKRTNALLKESGQRRPPIKVQELLKSRGVARWYSDAAVAGDAKLVVEDGLFAIRIGNEAASWLRTRFSIAHELGHTEFYDIRERPPRRITPWEIPNRAEERACNLYAAELLMPKELVLAEIGLESHQETRVGCHRLLERFGDLQRRFQVSAEVVGRRLIAELNISNSILLGCRRTTKEGFDKRWYDKSQAGDLAWRVLWAAAPSEISRSLFIPRVRMGQRVFPKVRSNLLPDRAQIEQGQVYACSIPRGRLSIGNLLSVLKKNNVAELIEAFVLVAKNEVGLFSGRDEPSGQADRSVEETRAVNPEVIVGIALPQDVSRSPVAL